MTVLVGLMLMVPPHLPLELSALLAVLLDVVEGLSQLTVQQKLMSQ